MAQPMVPYIMLDHKQVEFKVFHSLSDGSELHEEYTSFEGNKGPMYDGLDQYSTDLSPCGVEDETLPDLYNLIQLYSVISPDCQYMADMYV